MEIIFLMYNFEIRAKKRTGRLIYKRNCPKQVKISEAANS